MSLIYLLLLIVLLFIGLIFAFALEIKMKMDTVGKQYTVSALWLYPFFEAEIELENTKPMLTIFLFEKKVYRGAVKLKKRKPKSGLMKAVKMEDVQITADYGFKNPAVTGIICGAMNIAKTFVNFKTQQFPNFMTSNDYMTLNATAAVNMGNTLVNLTKNKLRTR